MKTTSLEEMRIVMETYYEEVGVLCPAGVGLVEREGRCWLGWPPGGTVGTPSPATANVSQASASLSHGAGQACDCRSGEASRVLGLNAFLSRPQIHRLQTLLASSETPGRKYDDLV